MNAKCCRQLNTMKEFWSNSTRLSVKGESNKNIVHYSFFFYTYICFNLHTMTIIFIYVPIHIRRAHDEPTLKKIHIEKFLENSNSSY